MKRLGKEQKRVAILITLANANYPMTSREIGMKIGFSNGVPVASMLCDMWEEGICTLEEVTRIGKPAYLFWLTAKGREEARELGLDA